MTVESFPETQDSNTVGGWISRLAGRPVRYVLAGVLNTLVGFAAYPGLLWASGWFRHHYLLALLVVQILCVLFAFTTYKVGVFRSRGNLIGDFIRFTSYYATIFAVNWVTLPFFVEVVGINPIITQTVFNLFVVVFGYFWHSNITFKSEIGMPARTDGTADQAIGG